MENSRIIIRLATILLALERGDVGLAINSLNWIISRMEDKKLACERCKDLSDMELKVAFDYFKGRF